MEKNKDNLIALLLSILGFTYVVYYIFRASTNVVTSDYIRIVDSYLADVTDLKYLISIESISRIPFTFLARFINVKLFRYNVFFDKILGAFGLFIFNFVTVKYTLKKIKTSFVRIITSIVITFISFSLMAWEMILNGTGYAHFLTMGLIAITYDIFDKYVNCGIDNNYLNIESEVGFALNKETSIYKLIKSFSVKLILIIIITSLGFAGSYSVSYNCTLILFSFIGILVSICNEYRFMRTSNSSSNPSNEIKDKTTIKNLIKIKVFTYSLVIVVSIVCISLYMISNNTGEPLIPVGFKDITLLELLKTNPLFPIKFILKSLASSIIGVETFDYAINFGTITEKIVYIFGIIYILIILWTIFIVIKEKFLRRVIFPYLYVVYGMANYALIFLARYKFVRDEYGMTSRYALQYMFLSIGIIMILSMFIDKTIVEADLGKINKSEEAKDSAKKLHTLDYLLSLKLDKKNIIMIFISCICIFILYFGNVVTSCDEIYKADYRKIIYTNLIDIAKNNENYTDEELSNFFEYHRDPEHIRNAFKILKEQKLNVFSKGRDLEK